MNWRAFGLMLFGIGVAHLAALHTEPDPHFSLLLGTTGLIGLGALVFTEAKEKK